MRIIVLMMSLFLCGCMSAQQRLVMQEQAQEAARINTNIQNAVLQKPNLMGWSGPQVVQQFGATNDVATTYNPAGTEQDLKYVYIDGSSTKYEFVASIVNGVVTSVQYLPPHVLPPPPPAPDAAPADDPIADMANQEAQERAQKAAQAEENIKNIEAQMYLNADKAKYGIKN